MKATAQAGKMTGRWGTHSRNTEGTTNRNKETINSKLFSAEKRAAAQIVITL